MLKLRNIFMLSLIMYSINLLAIEKVQSIALKKGWNAIYLEVDPIISDQNISDYILKTVGVNGSIPIEVITTYFPNSSSVEYINSPNEKVWKKPSWNSWIRDDLPESFLTNLYDLEAGQAYLVRSSQDFTWKIKGEVRHITHNWQANSFNFVGFKVGDKAISFKQLFQNNWTARSIQEEPIYTLDNDIWRKVSLTDEAVERGKSYWVFARGDSDFEGSVELGLEDGAKVMNYLDTNNIKTVLLTNTNSEMKTVTLSLEDNEVPLSLIEKNSLDENIYTPVASIIKSFSIPASSEILVKLAVRRSKITTAGKKEGVLKMKVEDTGEVQYLPISAYGVIQ